MYPHICSSRIISFKHGSWCSSRIISF